MVPLGDYEFFKTSNPSTSTTPVTSGANSKHSEHSPTHDESVSMANVRLGVLGWRSDGIAVTFDAVEDTYSNNHHWHIRHNLQQRERALPYNHTLVEQTLHRCLKRIFFSNPTLCDEQDLSYLVVTGMRGAYARSLFTLLLQQPPSRTVFFQPRGSQNHSPNPSMSTKVTTSTAAATSSITQQKQQHHRARTGSASSLQQQNTTAPVTAAAG